MILCDQRQFMTGAIARTLKVGNAVSNAPKHRLFGDLGAVVATENSETFPHALSPLCRVCQEATNCLRPIVRVFIHENSRLA
ncbi:hypothetical protein FQZ97_507840 [compost metagenome]